METTHDNPTATDRFSRLPPHDVEAEMCLIASVFLDHGAWVLTQPIISSGDFFQADNQIIWDTVGDMRTRGQGVDAITLRGELEKRGTLEEVGGVAYLATVIGALPATSPTAHAAYYAERVAETSRLRRLISLSNDVLRSCYAAQNAVSPSIEILERTGAAVARLSQGGRRNQAARLSELLDDARAAMAKGPAEKVTLGFRDVDAIGGGGLELGELMLVGARPSMGKSTWARQVWIRAAKAGIPSVLFSLEEGRRKIARNVLSAECRIENKKMRGGLLGEHEWREVDSGIARLRDLPAFEVENMRRVPEIHAELSRLITKEGVRLVLIDYLQRLNGSGKDSYERAGEVSQGVSDMLKELNVAGVVPAQLNRGVEHREDKRPNMSDLRDSGRIEQDADAILFLHREDYYHITEEHYEPTGVAELIIGKWRDAERGSTVRLKSELRFQTFDDFEEHDPFAPATGRLNGTFNTSRPGSPGGVAVDDLPWGN
jgi:replicative DNA helicase